MSKLIVTSDEAKLKLFNKKSSKCPSFRDRTKLAQELSAQLKIPKDKGFIVTSPDTFEEIPDIVSDVMELTKLKNISDWSNINKKNTRADLLDQSKLTLDSSFIKFALRRDVISTVSNYMGHVPILNFIMVMYSRYYEDKLVGAQLYHCDYQDLSNVMIFMNITDIVDAKNGPVTIIKKDKSKELRQKLLPNFDTKIQLNSKQELLVKDEWKYEAVGKAGSAVFVDSCSCFHYGSRISKSSPDRLMVMFHYLSPAAINVDMTKEINKPFLRLDSDNLDIYQKYIIGV